MARDFEDDEREFGGAAVRAALDSAAYPFETPPPFGDEGTDERTFSFSPSPYVWRDPAVLPRRQFLYGFELRRKQVSAVIAPGAAGKTTYKIGRGICMASGHEKFGHRVWNGPHRVWLWNLEDEKVEIEKSVASFLKLWGMDPADLGDRLIFDGSDSPMAAELKLAVEDAGGFKLQRSLSNALIETLKRERIDYLDIDPFVSSHSVDENSNQAIDAVAKEWLRIAQEADCAIGLAHHTRKSLADSTAQDARGAGAMVNAARSVLVLQTMTKEAASNFGVPECDRRKHFSVFDDKNNKAPAAAEAEWYKFVGIGLGNGDETGPEDNIGACERWQTPDMFAGISSRHLYHIQKLIEENPAKTRRSSMATLWVGHLIGEALDRDSNDKEDKKRLIRMIDTWIENGALKVIEGRDAKSMPVPFVGVGKWVEL